MRIGIIGGTGGMGEGFALRWCFKHDVIVGSRDKNKAKEAAEGYLKIAREAYGNSMTGSLSGDDNYSLVKGTDIIVLCIPYESIDETCSRISKDTGENTIIISPIVPMTRSSDGLFVYIPFEQAKTTAAEKVAQIILPRSRIVSAFHTISEVKLKNIRQSLDSDTFICGDDQNSIGTVSNLISDINGLRPIYLGPLSLTYQAEILTPMLLNAAKKNKMKNPGIRLV